MKISGSKAREIADFVFRIVKGFVSDRETAKDLTQQILLKAVQKWGSFEGKSEVSTWIYRMAVNTVTDHFRRPKLVAEQVDWYDPQEKQSEDLKNDIRHALTHLSPERREVMALFFFTGRKLAEIADALSIPIGTAASHLARGKEELKGYLMGSGYDYE